MIDIANYKRAVAWLERCVAAYSADAEDQVLPDSLAHSFGVTYNVTESILRQALGEVTGDTSTAVLSSRELMRYAADEGLALCSAELWLRYGIALERTNETLGESFRENLFPLLRRYLAQLKAFAVRLEGRLVPLAA